MAQAEGAGPEQVLLEDGREKYPGAWSRDGRYIVYTASGESTSNDVLVLPLFEKPQPILFAKTMFLEGSAQFSPDGRWIAYQSSESGRTEVYVQSFPGGRGKWQISANGGTGPRWRKNGQEIYFLSLDNKMMTASVALKNERVAVGKTQTLFDVPLSWDGLNALRSGFSTAYDVSSDGERFLVIAGDATTAATKLQLVVNWPALMKN